MIRTVVLAIDLMFGPAVLAQSPPRLEWHAAPAENLERIDVATIGTAKHTIDMAAYVLTDWVVMDALREASERGVGVRLVLDGTQYSRSPPNGPWMALTASPNVLYRVVATSPNTIMHLKAYEIDGKLLRTGSANFSPSGLKRQDNDLLLTDAPAAVTHFEQTFESIWDKAAEVAAR